MLKNHKITMIVAMFIGLGQNLASAEQPCSSRCCREEYPQIVVAGEAKIETMADKAYFQVRLRTEEKKLDNAFKVSTDKINAISGALSKNGVKKEDTNNLGYVYHPLYEGKRIFSTIDRPTSYEVTYTLKVTVYQLDSLGKILAELSEIAETNVFGLTYTSTKIEQLKREVLKKAAMDAREKAVNLTEGSGATLGKVMRIDSHVGFNEQPMLRRGEYDMEVQALAMAQKAVAAPDMESGYLEIAGNCTVVYALP